MRRGPVLSSRSAGGGTAQYTAPGVVIWAAEVLPRTAEFVSHIQLELSVLAGGVPEGRHDDVASSHPLPDPEKPFEQGLDLGAEPLDETSEEPRLLPPLRPVPAATGVVE